MIEVSSEARGMQWYSSEEKKNLMDNYSMFPRFPSNLGRIGAERDYIRPRTVAIGPYFRRMPELQLMERVKRMAVHIFFREFSNIPWKEILVCMRSIICEVRGCYSDTEAVAGISDDEFCEMMLIDGLFLLLVINLVTTVVNTYEKYEIHETYYGVPKNIEDIIHPHIRGILRDIMLLENQIPWGVLVGLVHKVGLPTTNISYFLVDSYPSVAVGVRPERAPQLHWDMRKTLIPSDTHLLGVLISLVQDQERDISVLLSGKARTCHASELAEMGIKLKATKTTEFKMKIVKSLFGATLALQPLDLDNAGACLLVNMAAFELCTEKRSEYGSKYPVSSYLCVLGLMMNHENDVRELRNKRIVQGLFGDQQTLEFFKDLCPNLVAGQAFWRIFHDIEEYRKKRWLWIAIYKFIYNNTKTIATVLSVIGVLVGIFKTLLSLKQNHQ